MEKNSEMNKENYKMSDKAKARSLVKEYLCSIGKVASRENEKLLETLASMSAVDFQSTAFPAVLLDGCYYMGYGREEYIKTTDAGIPFELFSDFCHSFVFCVTGRSKKEDIEQGHNTFKNYTLVQKRELAPSELCKNLPHGIGVEDDFYIVWTIYRRDDDATSDFGPKYFSVLAMTGDVLGNFGVVFNYGKHKPLCMTLPPWGIDWSSETFHQCNHSKPTPEVVRFQFVPQVKHIMDICFNSNFRPEFLLTLHPFASMGYDKDDYGSAEFYKDFMSSYFPEKVLEIQGNLCRNGAKDNLVLYRKK